MSDSESVLDRLARLLPLSQPLWDTDADNAGWPEAAVLIALTEEKQPQVLLGRRARHLKMHPGEIAFPGGKRERQDQSSWETALRETTEEVGIAQDEVTPLGELDPLITRTGFQVYPCIGAIAPEPSLTVDPGEFDSVFMLALEVFADPKRFRLEQMSKRGTTLSVPHYQVGDDNIWGVTAAMLAQLANVAYDAGFDLQRDWKQQP